jgi:hypothetical protein
MHFQTKMLWVERLKREEALVEGSPLPEPKPKAPRTLSVSYPFSTRPLLQDQVGGILTLFSTTWSSRAPFRAVLVS